MLVCVAAPSLVCKPNCISAQRCVVARIMRGDGVDENFAHASEASHRAYVGAVIVVFVVDVAGAVEKRKELARCIPFGSRGAWQIFLCHFLFLSCTRARRQSERKRFVAAAAEAALIAPLF